MFLIDASLCAVYQFVPIVLHIGQCFRVVQSGFVTILSRVLIGSLFGAALLPAASYKVVKSIPVPGEGFWDYLTADSENRRLYVSHGTEVAVLDLDSGKLLG